MKKTWRMVLTCAFIYVISFGLTAMIMGVEPSEGEEVNTELAQMVNTVSHQPRYFVKECDGTVAVYLEGKSTPIIETDICVSGLRQNDRELMEQGMILSSYTEVLYLLEDFGS